MSRRRERSESGYYHITTRGVGQMVIFESDADRRRYLRILKRAKDETGVRILAWVLMDNHTHLLIDVGEEGSPEPFMRRVNTGYASYFNKKTERHGHVFQGVYGSFPVKSEAQLAATVDYIHRNPERAQIGTMESYHWSSFQEYAGTHWVVDTTTLLDYFGSLEAMRQFNARQEDVVKAMRNHLDDTEALELAIRLAGVQTSTELRELTREERNEIIRLLAKKGILGKQIARIFAVGESTVSRVLRGI